MKLIEFPEQNIIIAKDQPEYQPMPALQCRDAQGTTLVCWKLSWRERLRILFSGKVWHMMLTFNQAMQPQLLMAEKPQIKLREAA